MFTVTVFWNAFLGFHGPPVTAATFEWITYDGKTPVYHPLQVTGVDPYVGNVFSVDGRPVPSGNVRCTGRHPTTGETRSAEFAIANGGAATIVI